MPSLLEDWYVRQCDGEWEHSFGVKIATLDNPGWSLTVDLAETRKDGAVLEKVFIERSENDWICYRTAENRFEVYCGPKNLSEAVKLFVDWFDAPA